MLNEKINKEAEPQIFKIDGRIYYAWYMGEEDDKVFYKTVDNEVICFRKGEIDAAWIEDKEEPLKEPKKKPRKKKA